MKSTVIPQSLLIFFGTLVLVFFSEAARSQDLDYPGMSKAELQERIEEFGLGFEQYVLGRKLTAEQRRVSEKVNHYKSYPGTVKFKDGEVFVIIDKEMDVVIALYKRNKKATKNDFKKTIADLMMQYGEPTTEAHGKTIYWSYGPDGLISEELYNTVKSRGKLRTLSVLATIKFNSSDNVSAITDMIEMMDEKNQQGESMKEANVSSDIYVMIQSDLLTKKYMNK